jgi:hypothetical protein
MILIKLKYDLFEYFKYIYISLIIVWLRKRGISGKQIENILSGGTVSNKPYEKNWTFFRILTLEIFSK